MLKAELPAGTAQRRYPNDSMEWHNIPREKLLQRIMEPDFDTMLCLMELEAQRTLTTAFAEYRIVPE